MAYRIGNKHPLDLLNRRKSIGFSLPFSGPAVFNPTFSTKDQIKSNLINYFLTNRGERVFNPFFGADLRRKLFENITTENTTTFLKTIQAGLKQYFPDVKIEELDIKTNPDRNYFNIKLSYSVIKFNINDSINLTLE